jgi:hypothetical protein
MKVKKKFTKIIFIFGFFLSLLTVIPALQAAVVRGPKKSIDQWVKEWKTSKKDKLFRPGGASILERCVVVKKEDDSYETLGFNPNLAHMESIFDTPSTQEVTLANYGNTLTSNDEEKKDQTSRCTKSLESAAACFDADCVLDITGNDWKVFQYNKAIKKTIFLASGASGKKSVYFNWLRKNLRYDGVILDQEDGFFLAVVPKQKYPRDSQALTVKGSAQKFAISTADSKGSGLMQLHSYSGRYAIFKLITVQREVLLFAPGTKFIMESLKF